MTHRSSIFSATSDEGFILFIHMHRKNKEVLSTFVSVVDPHASATGLMIVDGTMMFFMARIVARSVLLLRRAQATRTMQ